MLNERPTTVTILTMFCSPPCLPQDDDDDDEDEDDEEEEKPKAKAPPPAAAKPAAAPAKKPAVSNSFSQAPCFPSANPDFLSAG